MKEKMPCLFCASTDTKISFYPKVLFNNKIFIYHECRRCGLNFNHPLLTSDDYGALYPVDYHDEFYFKPDKNYDKQLEILATCNDIKSFVDYGCGDGGLLYVLSQSGLDCVGVEFNEKLVNRLREQYPGIRFYTVKEFDELKEEYHCIHLGDVLEHMIDPNGIVRKLTVKLKDKGYFFIEGPVEHNSSLAYWFRKAFFRVRKMIQPERTVEGRPFHTFLANSANQKKMLENNDLATQYFKLYETAWPFPEKMADCKNLKAFIEYLIAGISVFFSSFIPWLGNRFYYLGRRK